MTSYVPRELAGQVASAMESLPVVVVSGLRQSGKTTFLQQDPLLRGRRYLSLDDFAVLEQATRDPGALVSGDEPLTIDEAQRCPELLIAIKREVDRQRRMGHFVLSGSANFQLLRSIGESLAGRAIYLQMHTMTRRELARAINVEPYLVRLLESGKLPRRRDFDPVTDRDVLTGGMPQVALGIAKARAHGCAATSRPTSSATCAS